MNNLKKIFVLIIVSALLFTACAKPQEQTKTNENVKEEKKEEVKNEEKSSDLSIVTTLFPTYSFAKAIAPKANVSLLLPPGADSHAFEPSPDDILSLQKADVVVYTSQYMEEWFDRTAKAIDLDMDRVVKAAEGIDLMKGDDHDHEHDHDHDHDEDKDHDHDHDEDHDHDHDDHDDHDDINDDHDHDEDEDHDHDHDHHDHEGHHHLYDPHIWTSPVLAKKMAENIYNKIIEIDPANKDDYKANYDKLIADLDELDKEFKDIKANSKRDTMFFGSRFALSYFAHQYDFDVESVYDNCTANAEPNPREMAEVINEMKEEKAPVIFYEELVDPKLANQIAEEVGAKAMLFHSCHNLSKEDFEAGKTYVGIMKANAEALKEALN